jgi:LacI family transcriptional regulator
MLVPPRGVIARPSSDMVAIDDPETAAAIRFIREHAQEPITVKDVLGRVPICRKTLELRFEKLLGRTPKAEISRHRVDVARSLLEETDLPIPEVARNAGFISPRIFSSFFRSRVGVLPTQYRRNWRLAAGWRRDFLPAGTTTASGLGQNDASAQLFCRRK